MRIALTGTPCTGKTTLAQSLRERGEHVVDLKQWAGASGAIDGSDADGTLLIDTAGLDVSTLPADCVVEGHLSHELPLDAVWVVRCDPNVLAPRLVARGYSESKVRENLEAEAMDLLLQEALAAGLPLVQRDGSQRTPSELLAAFDEAKTDTLKGADMEPVDWSNWLMENA